MSAPAVDPGESAAILARNAIEEALLEVPDVPLELDRAGVGDRLRRAIQYAYTVLDTHVLAPAHHDGLREGATLVGEAKAMLAGAGDRREVASLGKVLDGLTLAHSALTMGAEAVAQIQLARRSELRGAGLGDDAPPPARPLLASAGAPRLHAIARRPLLPSWSLEARVELPAPAAPPRRLKAPETLEALTAFAEAATSGALQDRLSEEPPAPGAVASPEPPTFAYEPAIEEAEMLRRLARDCLEDVAIHRDLRKPNVLEAWTDQEPFEQRLLDNIDCFAAVGGVALPLVSLFVAEAKAPDPGRAFAAALVLGCVEGRDTIDAAVATLKQSAPETFEGWIEGLSLAPHPAIDAAMADLATGPRAALAVVSLEVLRRRRAAPFQLVEKLARSERVELVAPAARALGASGPREDAVRVLEEVLLRIEDDASWIAAAESAMRRGHVATRTLLRTSLEGDRPGRAGAAAWLVCLGGGESDLEPLLRVAGRAPTVELARGLGRFGHVGALGALVAMLAADDEALTAAAAEALERITGAGMFESVEEPWEIELPPEVADCGGLPIPTRKVERVSRDAARWGAWLGANGRRLDAKVKMRGGRPWTPLAIVDELESRGAPPERRAEAALELAITTGIVSPFSADDWVARQRSQLAELRRAVEALPVTPGTWAFGRARAEAPAPAPAAKVTLGETMHWSAMAAMLPAGALPFAAGSVAPAPPPAPRIEEAASPSAARPTATKKRVPIGGATGDLDPAMIRRALPFAGSPPASVAPMPPPAPTSVAPAPPPSSPSIAPPIAPAPPPMQPSVAPARPPAALVRTTGIDPSIVRAALPFQGSKAPAPAPSARAPSGGLPFAAAPPPPSLSLERYAWVCARCRADPGELPRALAQVGVASETAWREIDRAWLSRLGADRSLYERWQALVAGYASPKR